MNEIDFELQNINEEIKNLQIQIDEMKSSKGVVVSDAGSVSVIGGKRVTGTEAKTIKELETKCMKEINLYSSKQ